MKKYIFLFFTFLSFNSQAASSDSISLSQEIEMGCDISIDNASYNLDVINGETLNPLANLSVEYNAAVNITANFASVSSSGMFGHLVHENNTVNSSIDYEVWDTDRSIPVYNNISFWESMGTNTPPTYGTPKVFPLAVTVLPHAALALAQGTYSDTLTFTCEAQHGDPQSWP